MFSKHFYREPGGRGKWNGWIRYKRWVFVLKSSKPLFSERNGFTKYRSIGFGYRIRIYKDKA